jgi:hypothetical protein
MAKTAIVSKMLHKSMHTFHKKIGMWKVCMLLCSIFESLSGNFHIPIFLWKVCMLLCSIFETVAVFAIHVPELIDNVCSSISPKPSKEIIYTFVKSIIVRQGALATHVFENRHHLSQHGPFALSAWMSTLRVWMSRLCEAPKHKSFTTPRMLLFRDQTLVWPSFLRGGAG